MFRWVVVSAFVQSVLRINLFFLSPFTSERWVHRMQKLGFSTKKGVSVTREKPWNPGAPFLCSLLVSPHFLKITLFLYSCISPLLRARTPARRGFLLAVLAGGFCWIHWARLRSWALGLGCCSCFAFFGFLHFVCFLPNPVVLCLFRDTFATFSFFSVSAVFSSVSLLVVEVLCPAFHFCGPGLFGCFAYSFVSLLCSRFWSSFGLAVFVTRDRRFSLLGC